jgi:hypothetical protein
MAIPTKQSMAVQAINNLLNLIQQFRTLRGAVNEFVSQYTDAAWSTVWNALPTAPANADGSFGAADGAPNNAHPIDGRVVAGLQTSMAANDLVNIVAALQAFQAFCTGGAVGTLNRNQVLDLIQQG